MQRLSILMTTIGILVAFVFFGCGSEESNLQEKTDAFLKVGDYEGALKLIDAFIQEHPEKSIGRAMRVRVFTASGQIDKAFKEYRRFYKLDGSPSSDLLLQILLGALKDKDKGVREKAASMLGELGDRSAVPALIEALTDEYQYVRLSSAESLG